METLFEFVFTIFLEAIFSVMGSCRISLWIRIPFIVLFILIFGGLIIGLALIGIQLIQSNEVISGANLVLISLLLLAWFVNTWKELYKRNHDKK